MTKLVKEVPSSSNPSIYYKIYQDERGRIFCTCPGYEFREYCKHVTAMEGGTKNGTTRTN